MNIPLGTAHGKKRVWDAWVRICHWLIVACFAICWFTREAEHADLHAAAGYTLLVLVALRIAWGFVGTRHARISSFLYSPAAALRHLRDTLRRTAPTYEGHNPAGSWSIYVLWATGIATCITGIVALAAEKRLGPLAGYVGPQVAGAFHEVHELLAWLMLIVVAFHILGVALSSWSHRENLVAAMVTGKKPANAEDLSSVPSYAAPAFAVAAAIVGGAALYLHRAGWFDGYRELRNTIAATEKGMKPTAWSRECGSCHLAYDPGLLPMESWRVMLAEQAEHFGEDLGLRPDQNAILLREAAAVDATSSWPAWAIRAGLAPGASPQRITETPFWITEHHRIPAASFKTEAVAGKHDCGACHRDAASGMFSPRLIHLPDRSITK